MNKRFILTLFLFVTPFLIWAQEGTSLVTVTKASGTSFSLARGNEMGEYSLNLKEIKDLKLQPGDILSTKEKTSVEISIGNNQGRIKLGENTSLIFAHSIPGQSSAFILKKGIVKVQNKEDIPGNSIFVRTETLSTEVIRGEAGIWLHPKRQGSIDSKTEVFCLNGKSDIFVLKNTLNNDWFDKDPEYNEHFLQSGNYLSVRSDQAPLAVEETMSTAQTEWWNKFNFGEDAPSIAITSPEETAPEDLVKEEPKEEPIEIAKAEEVPTPPTKEEEILDDEVKESFNTPNPLREKRQRAGIVTMAGSSAMFLTGIITYAAMPTESKDIGTVLSAIGGGGAITGLIIFFSSYVFPAENAIPSAAE